jgi:hypothetical protein
MVAFNAFANVNAAFFIALQARVPALARGLPGTGKSTIMAALAAAMGRRFVALIGSQCAPEDFGGMPVPDLKAKLCRLMPAEWVEAFLTPGGLLFLDEITAVSPSVRAALLTLITERHVGSVHLDHDTLMAAACNPEELCPNGTPLELAMNNRFFHHDWKVEREEWLDGMATGQWAAPTFPLVPSDWESMIPKWGGRFSAFLRRTDGLDNVPPSDESRAYPSQRSWHNAVKCVAAADAAGADLTSDQSFVRKMVAGNVGEVAADQFCQFNAAFDLVDPLAVVDGTAKFKHNPARPDLTFCVCASIASAMLGQGFSEDRWNAAAGFFAGLAKDTGPEIPLRYTGLLNQAAAARKYAPPAKVLAPIVELAKSLR